MIWPRPGNSPSNWPGALPPLSSTLESAWRRSLLLLAENRPADALQLLEPLLAAASQAGLLYVVVEIRLLQALAAPVQKDALGYLKEALALAEPEEYIRTFVNKGEPMAALLRARPIARDRSGLRRRAPGGIRRRPARASLPDQAGAASDCDRPPIKQR